MRQTPAQLKQTVEKRAALDYLVALPDGYDDDAQRAWPVVLFLHGMGERGSNVNDIKRHGPPKLIEAGQSYDAIIVSPQCPESTIWSHQTDALMALLDKIENEYRVDVDRVYLTGLSMGGYGVLALGSRHPERFAAVVPICGGGSRIELVTLRGMPMWFFHGGADPVVPAEESVRLVEHLNRGGQQAKLTVYPGVDHDSWTPTYNDPEMWGWMLRQKRTT